MFRRPSFITYRSFVNSRTKEGSDDPTPHATTDSKSLFRWCALARQRATGLWSGPYERLIRNRSPVRYRSYWNKAVKGGQAPKALGINEWGRNRGGFFTSPLQIWSLVNVSVCGEGSDILRFSLGEDKLICPRNYLSALYFRWLKPFLPQQAPW